MTSIANSSAIAEGSMTLADAAEELGVHYMTAYRYVRTGRMIAAKVGGQWQVSAADLAAVIAEGTGPRRLPGPDETPSGRTGRTFHVEPFIARLSEGDTAGCWDQVTAALTSGATPVDIHHGLLSPALCAIGEGWRMGEITVAEEHRATATAWRLIGQMGPLFRRRGRRRGTVILGAVAGDNHAVPSAIMSDILCDRHFDVVDLGANTPTESFVEVAGAIDDLLGIGLVVAISEVIDGGIEQANQVRAALPKVPILLGGPVLGSLDGSVLSAAVASVSVTADEACDFFEKLADA